MKSKPSIVHSFKWIVLTLILVLSLIFCGLWASMEIKRFYAESQAVRKSSMADEREAIREDVEHILGYIDYKRKTTEQRVRQSVKSRTEQAYETAAFIYEQNRATSTVDEIKAMVYDALHAASWDNGRGYYFVIDTDGVERINRNNRELEGTYVLDQRDSKGTFLARLVLQTALSQEEGGFCSYYWNRPDSQETQEPKISFVKLFKPLGWVIGNGMYVWEQEERIKVEVLDWIENAHLDRSRYIFAGTWEGISLLGPAAGKNMLEVTDVNGVKIVRELIGMAKEGGGYVEYVMPSFEGYSQVRKLSYAKGVPSWEWYVGTGTDLDYIEGVVALKEQALKKRLKILVAQCVSVLGAVMLITLLWLWYFSQKLGRDLSLFLDFFSRSATKAASIPLEEATYKEFESLAESANTMAEERRSAWRSLKDSQNYLQAIFNAPSEAIVIHSAEDGAILDVNQAMLDMYGVSYEEALVPLEEIVYFGDYPYDYHEAKKWIKKAIEQGAVTVEWLVKRKDGSQFWIDVGLTLTEYNSSRFVIAVHRDVDARKKAEQVLAVEQERLAVTLRSIADGVIAADISGTVVLINRAAEMITGWEAGEAVGKPLMEVFHISAGTKDGGRKGISMVDILAVGKDGQMINQADLVRRDGRHLIVSGQGAPLYDDESKVIGGVLVFRDITHEKKTEQELLKVRKLESVGVLAGGIAHDFNNILSGILGNVELAGKMLDRDHQAGLLLSKAKDATIRASKLTQQLLTFAKGGEPVLETTELPGVIRESAEFVLHGTNITCQFDFGEDLWLAEVDPGQIGQVVQNIVLNARHAMSERGTVTIRGVNVRNAAKEKLLPVNTGKFVKISIQDTGTGISAEVLENIFDPYFSTKQEGSGLGLAICHSIINKHQGYIIAESSPDDGSIFTIFLPAATGARLVEEVMELETGGAVKAVIMVMDDDEMILDIAKSQLEYMGHTVVTVNDGSEAIETFRKRRQQGETVDIIIMDLTIPGGIGGKEAVQEILKEDPAAKVIVASGYSTDPVMAHYADYGFCAAVAKPFVFSDLEKAISALL